MKGPADLPKGNLKQWMIPLAMLSVYLFWGGTYLGMRVAVETMPPFIMAGVRFLIAGGVLYGWARLRGAERPKGIHWRSGGIIGALMLLFGNGMVSWAEQTVPSGIASLLVATVPLWVILLGLLDRKGSKPNLGTVGGMMLGFIGIFMLVSGAGRLNGGSGIQPAGFIALLLASVSWAAGSLYSRKAVLPPSPLLSTAIQMLTGGALLLVVSFFSGDWERLDISRISFRSFAALGYLVAFGSIVAYNAYIWLLKNAEPAWVSTYAFVNPVVAVFLGWAMLGEQLSMQSMAAAGIIIAAVVVVTLFRNRVNSKKIQAEVVRGRQDGVSQ